MGQIQFTIALVTLALFSIAIIGFAVNFASDNNAAISIANDPEISELNTNLQGNLTSFQTSAESTYQSIVESSITQGQTTPSGGQFAITPPNVIPVTKNIIKTGYLKIFGNGSGFEIFLVSFLGILVFIIGMYIWKTWAGRNPD